MKTTIRKQFDLPIPVVEKLKALAADEARTVKNYVERLIVKHTETPNKLRP